MDTTNTGTIQDLMDSCRPKVDPNNPLLAANLTNALNAAVEKLGLATGYVVRGVTDATDGYADYTGYMIDAPEGGEVARAYSWVASVCRKFMANSSRVEMRRFGTDGQEFLSTNRWSLGG